MVRTPACHAGGRGFKSLPSRHLTIPACAVEIVPLLGDGYADIAQSVERILGKDEVGSSNLPISSKNRSFRLKRAVFLFVLLRLIAGRSVLSALSIQSAPVREKAGLRRRFASGGPLLFYLRFGKRGAKARLH